MHPTFDAADQLRRARRGAGLTQRELAGILGRSPAEISRMETRRRPVDADLLYLVLELAGLRLDVVAGLEPSAGHRPRGDVARRTAAPGVRRVPSERLLVLRHEAASRWGVDPRSVCRCPDDAPDAS